MFLHLVLGFVLASASELTDPFLGERAVTVQQSQPKNLADMMGAPRRSSSTTSVREKYGLSVESLLKKYRPGDKAEFDAAVRLLDDGSFFAKLFFPAWRIRQKLRLSKSEQACCCFYNRQKFNDMSDLYCYLVDKAKKTENSVHKEQIEKETEFLGKYLSECCSYCTQYFLCNCCCPPLCFSFFTEVMYGVFCQERCEKKELRAAIQEKTEKECPPLLAPRIVTMGQSFSSNRAEIEEFYTNLIAQEAKAFLKKVFPLILESKEAHPNYYVTQAVERLLAFNKIKEGSFDRVRLSTPTLLSYISYLNRHQQQTAGAVARDYAADYAVIKAYMSSGDRTCRQIGSVMCCCITCCKGPPIEEVIYAATEKYVAPPEKENGIERFINRIEL